MVGIHGCGWMRGNIIEVWDTERRQSASRMVVVSCVCTPEQPKDNKKQDLARRGKGGYSSHGCAQGTCYEGKSPPQKQTKRDVSKKANRTEKREQTTSTDIPTKHTKCNA
jgi:hypothetical protein